MFHSDSCSVCNFAVYTANTTTDDSNKHFYHKPPFYTLEEIADRLIASEHLQNTCVNIYRVNAPLVVWFEDMIRIFETKIRILLYYSNIIRNYRNYFRNLRLIFLTLFTCPGS